ncbi:MAG: peptidoglycan bridge formation glycyltransferase FemA/FemB family protein [Candidatus Paceibacterota bacterium]
MKVKEINNKEKWEGFLKQCEEKTFLDSWNWSIFQEKLGKKVWRLGVFEDELKAVSTVIKIDARRGTFLFIPHGPVCKPEADSKQELIKILLKKVKKIAGEENASFLRVGPIWERNRENKKAFDGLGFKKAPLFKHPELTLELDVTLPERGLLKNMRKSTRRSIRKAPDKGVETFKSKDVDDLDKFYELYEKVVERNNFVPFSLDYIKKEFSTFSEDDQILTIFSRYKGEILSSAVVVYWQGRAFYHHGASDLKYDVPISHPVQWEAIKEAKRRDCKAYNFWGVAPEDASDAHPWSGLTLFKTGFGGKRKKYVKTRDYPFSLRYWPTYWFEKLRRKNRNL